MGSYQSTSGSGSIETFLDSMQVSIALVFTKLALLDENVIREGLKNVRSHLM